MTQETNNTAMKNLAVKKTAVVAIALFLGAYSDSSGPKEANVSGSWSYTATNLAGDGVSCSVQPSS